MKSLVILRNTIWQRRVGLIGWGVGYAALVGFLLAFYPSMKNLNLEGMNQLINNPAYKAMLGDLSSFTTADGYLKRELFIMTFPLMTIIYGILFGRAAIAGEERDGTLAMVLATPQSRRRFVLEKSAALAACSFILGAVFWIALVIAMPMVGMHLKLVNVAAATLLGVLVGMVFGYMTLAISAIYNRRAIAVIITVYVAIQSYFLNTLGESLKELHTAQKISPFYYAAHGNPLLDGLAVRDTLVLTAVCVVFVIIAVIGFNRRDIRN